MLLQHRLPNEKRRPREPPLLIDTHCHLTYDELAPQIDAVLSRAAAAGVTRAIHIATSPTDARRAIELMQTRPQIHLCAGVHPHEAGKVTDDDLAALAELHRGKWNLGSLASRLVAVGETGLDFHYDFAPRDVQERVFRAQLELACDVGRPVVIHARKAEERVCEILAEYPALRGRVVFHCFSGGASLAERIFDAGWWVSFTGVVTFDKSGEIPAAARMAPRDRFMVETDAPYLSPIPVRKIRPCEPAFVAHTARYLADIRQESFESLAEQTSRNAEQFFALPSGA